MSRFSPVHELALVWRWPKEYTLRFRADTAVFVLGACVTETDRQFYSPRVKYTLKLKDSKQKVMQFCKDETNDHETKSIATDFG